MKASPPIHSPADLLLLVVCLAVSPALAQTNAGELGDDYAPGDYGRVRFEENGVTIVRAETKATHEFPSSTQVNAPIFPGDSVTTEEGQRVEIQLADGSLVRVDEGSRLVLLSLPDPYRELRDHTVLQLAEGVVRVEVSVEAGEVFRIDTPACAVAFQGEAELRVEVRGDRTRVASRRGVAEVATGGATRVVRGGTATEVVTGHAPQDSEPFNTMLADDFDRWVAARQAEFAVGSDEQPAERSDEVPEEIRQYYAELSQHGDWNRDEAYGTVWVPHVTAADWRPYRHGRWGYGPRGYFWVSNEPWGWAPYHYGRWAWIPGFGWSWIPGRVFGGAWVSWSWGAGHLGWCALDYWNRPAVRHPRSRGGHDRQSWTFVDYDAVGSADPATDYVGAKQVSDLNDAVVVTRAPRVAPSRLAESAPRNRARAEARADTRARLSSSEGTIAVPGRRSFVELERQTGVERKALTGTARSSRASGNFSIDGDAAKPGRRNPNPRPGVYYATENDGRTDDVRRRSVSTTRVPTRANPRPTVRRPTTVRTPTRAIPRPTFRRPTTVRTPTRSRPAAPSRGIRPAPRGRPVESPRPTRAAPRRGD